MGYLYFQPKPALGSNKKWTSTHHQRIIQLLQNSSKKEEIVQIHAQMIRTQLIQDNFLVSRIIAFLTCACSPSMNYACHVFDQIPHPNLFTWNSMIRGYTHHHAPEDALLVFKSTLHGNFPPDSYTYTILASACASFKAMRTGMAVHGMVMKSGLELDMFVMSGLVNFYGCSGEISTARGIFDEMPERDVVAWTSMMSGYAQLNHWDEAFLLFDRMMAAGIEPDKVTMASLLSACGQLMALYKGHWLHSRIVECGMEHDIVVGNSLVSMYAKCGIISSATEVFNGMTMRNVATWNSLIGGFVQNGLHWEALAMFQEMTCSKERPDEITVANALLASAHLGNLQQGKLLHAYIENHKIPLDVFIGNNLINMYAKCGDLVKAEAIFLEMPVRDVYSWTTMISSYVQGSRCKEALALFEEMRFSNVEANEVTLVSVLSACAELGALDQGQQIHAYIEEHELKIDVCLGNALVNMYAKCGCIKKAAQIFNGMPQKDIFSWNAMIGGLATNGLGREALDIFSEMQSIGDPKPDKLTLLAVLSACSHSGMVSEGLYYFNSMYRLCGNVPGMKHYGCVVDLLGRAGLIDEANDFIWKMPMAPNSVVLGSLLAACRVHRKMGLGHRIAQNIIRLAPDDEGVLVLLSNLYAEAGWWDDVRRVRDQMGSKGIEKSPGCSLIEVNGVIHEFFVGGRLLHHDPLHLILEGLCLQSKQTIYMNQTVL